MDQVALGIMGLLIVGVIYQFVVSTHNNSNPVQREQGNGEDVEADKMPTIHPSEKED